MSGFMLMNLSLRPAWGFPLVSEPHIMPPKGPACNRLFEAPAAGGVPPDMGGVP